MVRRDPAPGPPGTGHRAGRTPGRQGRHLVTGTAPRCGHGTCLHGHVADVLRQAGVLDDDRRPRLRRLAGPQARRRDRRDPPQCRALAAHPQRRRPGHRPRRIATVHSHLGKALPALLDWSAPYHHLREVTRDDIRDHVHGLHGPQRHNALVALRSLFGFCLSAGVTFSNPALGIKVSRRPSGTVLQPLGQDDIDNAVAAAATPAARLIVALAGVHAARSSTICALLLSDADRGSGRLLLGGRPRPLDDLTARLLRTWLEARRARWPGTANPHLLINAQTALGTGRPAEPGQTPPCAATPRRSRPCASTASSRKPSPPAPIPCTWQPPSAWTPAPQSATRPAPGSSSKPQPSSRTPPGPPRTQGPEPLKNTENPSVPAGNPSVWLNSGEREAPGK